MLYGFLAVIVVLLFLNLLGDKKLMATLADVTGALGTLSTDVDELTSKVNAFVSAEGSPVPPAATAADLDVLVGTISSINSKVNSLANSVPVITPSAS